MASRRLDVVFVIPGNLSQVYQHLGSEHAIEPPAMARFMASYLMRRNCGVAIIDAVAERLSDARVAALVDELNPILVVVPVYGYQPSASTQNMPAARSLCQAIKDLRPDLHILMTGTHPAALPERTLLEEPIDFVCDGEGPITIHETLEALRAYDDLGKPRGLWRQIAGRAVKNEPAPNIVNLDAEPPDLAWKLLDPKKYYCHDWHSGYGDYADRTPYANVITELGCPFHCPFCCIQAPFKSGERTLGLGAGVNSYRLWSPDMVIREIEYLVTVCGVIHIKFPDEMFVLNPRHVFGVADLIFERFGDRLNIWAYARIDTAKPHFLARLRRAGFKWLAYGIEAAESRVRDGQDKDFDDAQIVNIIKLTEAAGINVVGNYIFGLPGDTLESMQRTLELAMSLNTAYGNFYCAMAYPGSALYHEAKRRGLPLPDDPGGPGWIGYSQHAYETMPLPTETLTADQVLRFRDTAWRTYYTAPAFTLKIAGTLGEKAAQNVKSMTALPPLKRKLFGD